MIGPGEHSGDEPDKPIDPESLLRSMERSRGGDPKVVQSRELFYDAMEFDPGSEQEFLLKTALDLDPRNVDALLAMLPYERLEIEEEVERLEEIVEIAETDLGSDAFENMAGHFWGFHETRPYMRARAALADALFQAGGGIDAIAEWQGMLALNPGDNQGVRYMLLPCWLQLKVVGEAVDLLNRFPYDVKSSAVFAWCKVLTHHIAGDLPAAAKALAAARKVNGYAEAYIKGHKRVPKRMPDAYAMGSPEEAACFAVYLMFAWHNNPTAMDWLEEQAKR